MWLIIFKNLLENYFYDNETLNYLLSEYFLEKEKET